MTFPLWLRAEWLSAERLRPKRAKNAVPLRRRAPCVALCVLAALGCKGSFDTQEDRSGLRPSMRGGSAGAPGASASTELTTPAAGEGGESPNVDRLGDPNSPTRRGGGAARRTREPEPEDAGVGELDAGEVPEDAGVLDDAGSLDAGGADAGALGTGAPAP